MISRMTFISLVAFLLFAVVGGVNILLNQENFRDCRNSLDDYAKTDCQRAQNIHFCTEILNGQIKSRGNQELNRLKCKEEAKDCKTSNIQICRSSKLNSCSDLNYVKHCLYQQDCTKHFELLDKYYTDVCLKIDCNSSDVAACDTAPKNTEKDTVCLNLMSEYHCVLNKRSYTNGTCRMPTEWQKTYKENTCERLCYEVSKPSFTDNNTGKEKCDKLKSYKSRLETRNCNMSSDMEIEYKKLKCDTDSPCKKGYMACHVFVNGRSTRKENCKQLSLAVQCSKNTVCPTEQKISDQYAFYGCETSCNGDAFDKCSRTLKQPLNSTREEQCGYYKEVRDCIDKSKCEGSKEYSELLECDGAASRNAMFSIIILALLTVQMLERYISLS
ncbi:uncharacterized protein LOC106882236 [Octopus bimaculoides]|uniref:GDNF/GAS1 domain-containing protein n=1 Tax=Octopus bimaculoides TaxID=37653 RepID=A0A0L8FN98_OCTBM|nr:uncharacterized protein LOC106882236 [Octopus bimaculoides]|eukprot:XP_014788326.1 PREDICTED: uncharacterized protein LOC106882236 [Octopus bimaculoides]